MQVAYALKDGYWEISDVGTTQYVSQFKQYNVSENEETLVATDNLTYDANGIRTRKVVPTTNGTKTTEYIYSGSNLFQEKVASNQKTPCKCKGV